MSAININTASAWEMGIAPLDLFDANGMLIRRAITEFDIQTGEVTSHVLNREGNFELAGDMIKCRVEKYPAPLLWKTITQAEAKTRKHQYWDLSGR